MFTAVALKFLLLLVVANGSPLLASMLVTAERPPRPLDGGRRLADGRPLWGPSKTVRGVVIMVSSALLLAPLLGFPALVGLLTGIFVVLGDLFSSFIKRRLGLASGAMALGLDQVPEALFPLLVCQPLLGFQWSQLVGITLLFVLSDLALSRLFWLLGFRQHPH